MDALAEGPAAWSMRWTLQLHPSSHSSTATNRFVPTLQEGSVKATVWISSRIMDLLCGGFLYFAFDFLYAFYAQVFLPIDDLCEWLFI